MPTKRRLGSGQPEPPPWPEAPEGWRWSRTGTPCQLEAPDGWHTANYNYPERALAEAQRRILSQPKPKPPAPPMRTTGDWSATDLTSELLEQLQASGIHWRSATRTPDGRWHHLIGVHNTALFRTDQVRMRLERLQRYLGPDELGKEQQAMTAATMNTAQAIDRLRKAKYTVKPHGARYLVGATSADTQVMTADELMNFASTQAWIAGDAPAEAPAGWTATCGSCGQSFISHVPVADGAICPSCSQEAAVQAVAEDGSIRLMDLMAALEAHAKRIAGLAADKPIPLPMGLPDRLQVPIDLVVSGRYQPRTTFDDAALGELADSIREHGILRAPIVFANEHGTIELIGGERRIRAARLAGLSMVPVEFRSYTMAQIAEISGLDNFHAAELSPIEKGAYFNRLMSELKMSENALAKRLGLPRTHIQQCRAVASGAPELHKALAEGQITFSHARSIAQAAPGEHKTQKQALALIAERVRSGRTVTETEAKAETEKLMRKRLEGDLKKLGWQFTSWGEIWSPSERPKAWTGAEMIEAVKSQRRPSGAPIEGLIEHAELHKLQWQHEQVSQACAPWIGLRKTYSSPWSYVAPDEVPALVETIQTAMDALQARVRPHGFAIDPGKSTYTRFEVKGQHVSQTHYSWAALEGCVKQIEAGELVDKPREQQQSNAPGRQPVYSKCEDCKKPAPGGLMWVGGKNLCSECRAPIFAALTRQKADRAIGAWLRSAPAGALPLIYAAIAGEPIEDEGATADSLLEAVGTYLRDFEDEFDEEEAGEFERYAPNVAKLLASVSAPAAEPALPAEAEQLLLGDIPADSPLAPIEAAVINIHQWCRISGASASDEEIAVNAAELRTISDDLDGLSADENITDEQFEMLSTAIGKLATALRELREERAVAA